MSFSGIETYLTEESTIYSLTAGKMIQAKEKKKKRETIMSKFTILENDFIFLRGNANLS